MRRPVPAPDESRLELLLQKWADGQATLKDVRGYTDEELYAIARTGWIFFQQGKIDQARVIFQGLYAVNPADAWFARALGVVEFAAGNQTGALSAWDIAIKLDPKHAAAWVGRAEVKLALGQKAQALEDLRRADQVAPPEDPLRPKITAMLQAFTRR